jgi:hypothetical protein
MQASAEPADTSAPALPTAPRDIGETRIRRGRNLRRLFFAGLSLFLLAGVTGVLGIRTGEVSASGGGFDLTVTYAAVSRPGLATPWEIEVHRAGGFDGPITIATSELYLGLFDANGLNPDPAAATTTADMIIWEFEPPPGDTLLIAFDARIEPAAQWGASGTTSILVDGQPLVTVTYRTQLMP